MFQATILGQTTPKTTSKHYCLKATVGGPPLDGKGPFQFSFGGCITDEKDFDFQKGTDAVSELKNKYQAGDICWYGYQYEDKSGAGADVVGPSTFCAAKYKDDPEFQKTVTGIHQAFLAYIDLVKTDPNAKIPDIRKYLDIPPERWSGQPEPSKWKRWALIGAIAAVVVAGGVVIYTRRTPRRARGVLG